MALVNHLEHPIDEVYKPYVPETLEELLDCFPAGSAADDFMWRGQANLYWTPFPTLYRRIRGSGYSDMQLTKAWFGMSSRGSSRRLGLTGRFAAAVPFWSSWPACSITAVRRACLM